MNTKRLNEWRYWVRHARKIVESADIPAGEKERDPLTPTNSNQWTPYLDNLDKICVPIHICPTTHAMACYCATAAQRAEALIAAITHNNTTQGK